jgi:hypothetical protein
LPRQLITSRLSNISGKGQLESAKTPQRSL